MTWNKERAILDLIVPPIKPVGLAQNKEIASVENVLFDIVIRGEAIIDVNSVLQQYVEDSVRCIVEILRQIEYNAKMQIIEQRKDGTLIDRISPNQKGVNIGQTKMPFLIKQVLFYLACNYIKVGKTQKEFIELITEGNKICLTKNFFTNLGYSPIYGEKMINYVQPDNPIHYMGQKKGELGIAIKMLVYQAGVKSKSFVDVFGGSGSASVAVCQREDLKIVYNEKSRTLANLIEVLKNDNLFIEFIQQLKFLAEDLYDGKLFIRDVHDHDFDKNSLVDDRSDQYELVDFSEEIEKFVKPKKGRKGDDIVREDKIGKEYSESYYFDWDYLHRHVMPLYEESVKSKDDSYIFEVEGNIFTKEDLLNYKDVKGYMLSNLQKIDVVHEYLISELAADEWLSMTTEDAIRSNIQLPLNERVGYFKVRKKQQQHRFYRYYAFFSNIINEIETDEIEQIPGDEKILYAIGYLFLQAMEVRKLDDGISSIFRMYNYERPEANRNESKPLSFIKKIKSEAYIQELTLFHDAIKKFEIYNKDFEIILREFMYDKNTLFYSDSPYLKTAGYRHGFTEEQMNRLIFLLMEGKSKFIFSCRAAKSSEDGESSKDLSESNKIIYNGVFQKFKQYLDRYNEIKDAYRTLKRHYKSAIEEYGCTGEEYEKKYIKLCSEVADKRSLNVLAIEKGGNLAELIRGNKIAEIMITNYPICSFVDFSFENVNYTVYSYENFMKILDVNMNK